MQYFSVRARCAAVAALLVGFVQLACEEPPRLSVREKTVHSGQSVQVDFGAPLAGAAGNQYWLQIVPAGRPDSDVEGRAFIGHGTSSAVLIAPASGGTYELRLHDHWPEREFHPIGRAPLAVRNVIHVSQARP